MRLVSIFVLVIGCTICLASADPARGQHSASLRYQLLYNHNTNSAAANTPLPVADSTEEYSTGALYLGGILGWTAGFAGGAYAGYWFLDRQAGEIYIPAGTALGALAGSAVGTPLGVHIFNGDRGNYLFGLLGSSFVAAGTAYFLVESHQPVNLKLLTAGMAAAQIVVSVSIENATSD